MDACPINYAPELIDVHINDIVECDVNVQQGKLPASVARKYAAGVNGHIFMPSMFTVQTYDTHAFHLSALHAPVHEAFDDSCHAMTTHLPLDEASLTTIELEKLRKAQQKELQSFDTHNVYERVPIHMVPQSVRAIPTRFINTQKLDVDTMLYNYKSRLVAIGLKHLDQRGDLIDFTTAMPPLESFRMFLAFAAAKKGFNRTDIQQADVATAFLQSDLASTQPVYVLPPKGHPDEGVYVWRLLKSMYGIRDAPRHWELHLRKVLINLGWQRTIFDGIYIRYKHGDDGSHGYIDGLLFTWVDDLHTHCQALHKLLCYSAR
jgi:hypothetical protein